MRVCYSETMRRLDRLAAENFNIPGVVLMENAAIACTNELQGFESVLIFCGKGNNGGDGLAIARQLIVSGKRVRVCLCLGRDFSGDALINYNALTAMGADIEEYREDMDFSGWDCTVDAVFGTGFRGAVEAPVSDIIEKINKSSKYILSVDVPSGINADTGEVETVCVRADKTVTFAALKPGLLLYPAADCAGEIILAHISMPEAVFEREHIDIKALDAEYIKSITPQRTKNSHKGDYGKVLVIGGSVGMAGAVSLACRSALKSGAGLVTACVPAEINDIVQCSCTEAMTCPVDFEKDSEKIVEKIKNADVILFGNGIGRADFTENLLRTVLENACVPIVIDADGLFALAKNTGMLDSCSADVILTPHTMEMSRLVGKCTEYVEKNRLELSMEFAKSHRLTLVLKGNHSIITAPDGSASFNMTGNSGMATAGSGDVLAGMCAAFAAVCGSCYNAAELAVYAHGAAGDAAKLRLGEFSLTASDIISEICHTLPVEKTENI